MWSLLLAVIVGTWNGNWFPSGRAEHRAAPEVETARIESAGRMLGDGIRALDPEGREDVILCLNEMRGPHAVMELGKATGLTNLSLAVITGYRRRDRFDMQQDVILTTLPVVQGNWSLWKRKRDVFPPRGFAHAKILLSPAVTASVYSVHLKSNYGATSEKLRNDNRVKRQLPVEQLLEMERLKRGRSEGPVVITGDFNADPWREEFKVETIFGSLAQEGFFNVFEKLPPDQRWTYPNKRYGNSALDHIYVRGMEVAGAPVTKDAGEVSDHYGLFVRLAVPPAAKPKKEKSENTPLPPSSDL